LLAPTVSASGSDLSVRGLATRSGSFQLEGIDLDVGSDEVLVVLGPSGAGKTMLLHTIAGFRQATAGNVRIKGREVTGLAPELRRIGFVFQDAALFPHLTARDNVCFGLRAHRLSSPTKVDELMDRFGVSALADRTPRSLSGGERQRVALARALAFGPEVLLLDEPLSALDQPTREELRSVLQDLLSGLGIPAVHVTHDRDEAFILADKLAVIESGKLRQVGAADRVAAQPADAVVAKMLGWLELGNGHVIDGKVVIGGLAFDAQAHSGDVLVFYRPEDIRLSRDRTEQGLLFRARVQRIVRAVPLSHVALGPLPPITALVLNREFERLTLRPDAEIEVQIPQGSVVVVPDEARTNRPTALETWRPPRLL